MGLSRKEVLVKKREIERHISKKIVNTEFYKRYKKAVLDWYNTCFEEILLVTGGYGIGKSRTIRQILDEEGIEYIVISDVFYSKKKAEQLIMEIRELSIDNIIIFDDCKLTRWMDYHLLHLLNEGYPIVIIANSFEEVKILDKVIGRVKRLELIMKRGDLDMLKGYLSEIYDISYNKYIILNLRDIVSATLKELLGINAMLTIDEIMYNVDIRKNRKKMLIEIVRELKRKGYNVDEELIIEIGVKVLGYAESTLRKNLARYLV